MRERGLEFRVGLLIVVAMVVLAGFLVVLGNFSLRSGFSFYVDYDFIGNLQSGAPVKVSGIKVGKVTDVEFLGGKMDERTKRRVQVRLTVWVEDRAQASIRSDAEFFINTAGVLGEQYLEIVPGHDYAGASIAADEVRLGSNPPRTDLVVSRLYEVLDGVSQVLRDDKDAIKNLLTNSSSAVSEVNKLLVDNREQLASLLQNASGLASEATTTLKKVNVGLGDPRTIGNLLNNTDALLVSARSSLTTLTPSAAALIQDATRVTGIINQDRIDRAIAVADKAAAAATQADGLLTNVNGLVTDLRAGKGTAGGLLARDDVYADLRELIRDLKRNPWKLFWKE
jgi:phospholipid/cholesterol/gamma-HCH transport system substrate-binding protein